MLRLDDLTGAPRLRKKAIVIDGVGDIEVHELSTAEQWKLNDERAASADNEEESRAIAVRWAARALAGPGVEVSDEQRARLAENIGATALYSIARAAANFDSDTVETARKNSSSDRISDSDTD